MIKSNQLLKAIGIAIFVLLCGAIIIVLHFQGNQIFSREIYYPSGTAIDIDEIRRDMEKMDKEEIEETIIKIEKEIQRLKPEI